MTVLRRNNTTGQWTVINQGDASDDEIEVAIASGNIAEYLGKELEYVVDKFKVVEIQLRPTANTFKIRERNKK